MGKKPTELRFYARNHACVPERHGFYAIETVKHSTFYRGDEYIDRLERTGWLLSAPKKKVKFKSRKEMDEWIDQQVSTSAQG